MPGREVEVDELLEVMLEQVTTAKARKVGTSAVPFLKTYPRSTIVERIAAYVEGRPMPRSSRARTSVGSV